MPTAAPIRTTPDGIELERWERVPVKARWDAGKNYVAMCPHNCAVSRCEKPHEPFSGKVAHQSFSEGTARIMALDESATTAQMEQRYADLDWLANNGYAIRAAGRFVQVEEEAD